ncbi:uncharacterized protein ACWYII_002951 isoform 1-T1 [Salvelinus alpinus]
MPHTGSTTYTLCCHWSLARQIYLCMAVQKAASTFALVLYPFHAVTKSQTTIRIVSRDLSSTYTSPEHNAESYLPPVYDLLPVPGPCYLSPPVVSCCSLRLKPALCLPSYSLQVDMFIN